ncbi:MAG: SpoVR family protein [Acidobacteriota bacterium]
MTDKEVQELERAVEQIWDIAVNKFGLDPYPTNFEIVPATVMYEIGSYALPGRYSHWTFGKAYHRMKMMYDFGLSKIYEVVINSNPSFAFLLETNSILQNKLVIAHVLGHVDFFKHNAYFAHTNRRMVDEAAIHARRMNEYEFQYGSKVVEEFLDAVLSIEEHIDPNFYIKKQRDKSGKGEEKIIRTTGRFDDLFTPEELGIKSNDEDDANDQTKLQVPEKDLVYFIMQNSPILKDWQRDVISMLHQEMEYFVPQMQTKIMNEGWACATRDALVLTENGFIYFDRLIEQGNKIKVASGGTAEIHSITDFHKETKVPTLRIRTRRGMTIEGALKHRLLKADGSWAYLKDVKIGDRVAIECGSNVWAKEKPELPCSFTAPSTMMSDIARLTGVSTATIHRYLKGRVTRSDAVIESVIQATTHNPENKGKILATRKRVNATGALDESLAWLLGYFIGDGNKTKSGICLTCADQELSLLLSQVIQTSLGLQPKIKWDATEKGGRYRVIVHSRESKALLEAIGLNLEDKARNKKIPQLILGSPKEVVSAFLRGYFDADADAGKEGIRLSSTSKDFIHTVQIVLLNFGILSTQSLDRGESLQLEITGASAKRFYDEIGFSLTRKQEALRQYIASHLWFKVEDRTDEIIAIEEGCEDVFDITVDEKHAYVANGFVNHNSIWHSRIMREMDLPDEDHLEFAELHSGVVSPHRGQLNPYYLGYKIWEDIEKRWNNPSEEDRHKLGLKGGEGREKIFEVRETENDISFLRNYLTEELCEELDLFVYELVDEEEWTITEKRWEKVRNQLVANMTNFGFPYIEVLDGDYDRNRELYLKHRYEGVELDMKYAHKTLEYVYQLWGRDVHLETIVDGETLVLHFDGEEHTED